MKKNIESLLDSGLNEENSHDEAATVAIKPGLARQIDVANGGDNLSGAEFARRMRTSDSRHYRLLDPENDSGAKATLQKAACAIRRQVPLELF